MAATHDGLDNRAGHGGRVEQHGIVHGACQQRRVDEARTDVGEPDAQSLSVGQLLQSLQVSGLHGLGGAVGRRGAEPFRARYRGDTGDVPATLTCHAAVGHAHHPRETHAVGRQRGHLDVGFQPAVLLAYARRVEIEVYVPHRLEELFQLLGSLGVGHVDACHAHPPGSHGPQGLKRFLAAGRQRHRPSLLDQQSGHLAADTAAGPHDNSLIHTHNN